MYAQALGAFHVQLRKLAMMSLAAILSADASTGLVPPPCILGIIRLGKMGAQKRFDYLQVPESERTNEDCLAFKYKGGYWNARRRGVFEGCRDIFGPDPPQQVSAGSVQGGSAAGQHG